MSYLFLIYIIMNISLVCLVVWSLGSLMYDIGCLIFDLKLLHSHFSIHPSATFVILNKVKNLLIGDLSVHSRWHNYSIWIIGIWIGIFDVRCRIFDLKLHLPHSIIASPAWQSNTNKLNKPSCGKSSLRWAEQRSNLDC